MTEQSRTDAAYEHVVVTRFNVPLSEAAPVTGDAWTRHRLALFADLTVPGFAAQTVPGVRWLVLVDARSPEWLLDALGTLAEGGLFEVVRVDEPFSAALVSRLVLARTSAPAVLTTRVDSDDAVSRDFVAVIRAHVRAGETAGPHAVNLVTGAQLAGDELYLRPYTKNPFVSLYEPVDPEGLMTVYVDEHFHIDRHATVHNVRTRRPLWLQVVHEDNLANTVVGLRIPRGRALARFALPAGPPERLPELARGMAVSGARVVLRVVGRPSRVRELVTAATGRSTRRPTGPRS